MNAKFQKVTNDSICSFEYKNHSLTDFDTRYHYHPELEIFLVVEGNGKKIIGETISTFENGTLIVIGKNLPHSFRSDIQNDCVQNNHIIQLYFSQDFLGKDFFNIPEMRNIKSLLISAEKGLEILGETKKIITEKLINLVDNKDSYNLIEVLSILNILSSSKDVKNICNSIYTFCDNSDENSQDKLTKVYQYISSNFNKEISLSYASSLVNLSKSAFCHFFIKRTGKNFFRVINEIRIEFACRQLIDSDMSVTEICYASGYNTLSNFNKQFRQVTEITPLKYKQQMKKMLVSSNVETEELV